MIHFAHANGFPSECYQSLFDALRLESIEISYIPIIGHDQAFPICDNWSYLVDEVIHSVLKQSRQQPIVGVGHSLGGVLTLLAAAKQPELFSHVIVLDTPVFGFSKSMMIRLIKALGLIHWVTPSRKSGKRKSVWGNLEEAKSYLLTKSLYQSFDPICLDDYLKYALNQREDGQYQLRFEREKESLIFKTVPHAVYRSVKKLSVPISLIYSESSHIITAYELRNMQRKLGIDTYACSGSHLFPLEAPKHTAKLISKIIHKQSANQEKA